MAGRKKPRLSADEAREYSNSLAKAAAGDYELMDFAINTLDVPGSLNMDAAKWIEGIGGHIVRSEDDRRNAVQELSDEGRSTTQIATILGISKSTVERDLAVLKVASPDAIEAPKGGGGASPDAPTKKPSVAEQRPEIRKLLDKGKTDAEIAVAMGRGVATIQKERKAYRDEQDKAKLDAAQAEKPEVSEADEKAADAAVEQFASNVKKGVTTATGISPVDGLEEAARDLKTVMDADVDFDFDRALALWTEIGNDLWVYGAKRGLDVSQVMDRLERMKGGEDG